MKDLTKKCPYNSNCETPCDTEKYENCMGYKVASGKIQINLRQVKQGIGLYVVDSITEN